MKNASTVWGGVFSFLTRTLSTPSDRFRVRVPGNPFFFYCELHIVKSDFIFCFASHFSYSKTIRRDLNEYWLTRAYKTCYTVE